MADPHHVAERDRFDRFTVQLYRAGVVASGLALTIAGLAHIGAAMG